MFDHILAALKFSRGGTHCVRSAARLAGVHGARLTVFHAVNYRYLGREKDNACILACSEAEMRFNNEVRPILEPGVEIEFVCHPADPAMETCRLALTGNVDLIALGCHHRPGMALGRIDYTGMTIMEKAPCPVVLFPLFEEKPDVPGEKDERGAKD
jgi:nucleotide-binding universal stress UspA family protein